jgi:hypothetical protein
MSDNRAPESSEEGNGWFVSSFSNGGAACIEVKFSAPGSILVRDSKDRRHQRPIIDLPSHGWVALLSDITNRL